MKRNFGPGFDKGQERVKYIGLIMAVAFVLWFIYMGFKMVDGFFGFSW